MLLLSDLLREISELENHCGIWYRYYNDFLYGDKPHTNIQHDKMYDLHVKIKHNSISPLVAIELAKIILKG